MARLNSFFSLITLALVALVAPNSWAISLHALYTASCQREVGIILDVSPRQIFLLNLSGNIVAIERFEVISYAIYPLDVVPIPKVTNSEQVPLVRIKTFQKDELVELVRGWPVDFSKDKIAFLTLKGSERLIERRSIWQVDFERETKEVAFETQGLGAENYDFVHPYAFANCAAPAAGTKKKIKVYPQQLLSDPVAIKREMDRLVEGHKVIKAYESDQQFYAVPEVYGNETALGLWLATNSRYGASKHRQNNFTPYLTNEFSSGPFGFQSEFKSGAGPILHSLHEEPQTQIFYRMKADYFHFSAMVDPGLLLVGARYKWGADDLDTTDIRANDSALVEFGFDYGPFAFELHLGGATNIGAKSGAFFQRETFGVPKAGIRYQGKTWIFNLFGGAGKGSRTNLSIVRANLELNPVKYRKFAFSLISRNLDFDGDDMATGGRYQVNGKSLTLAGYGYWRVKSRYWVGTLLAAERIEVSDAGRNGSVETIIPKFGLLGSLSF